MTFLVSELATKRRAVVDAAREGGARVRDTDGTRLVMLPESKVESLAAVARWSNAQAQVSRWLQRGELPRAAEMGELAWLRGFDHEDLAEFVAELQDALAAAYADADPQPLVDCVRAWQVTARQLEDPLRRSILLGRNLTPDDLVPVDAPNARHQ
jgi:hypothetical protein